MTWTRRNVVAFSFSFLHFTFFILNLVEISCLLILYLGELFFFLFDLSVFAFGMTLECTSCGLLFFFVIFRFLAISSPPVSFLAI